MIVCNMFFFFAFFFAYTYFLFPRPCTQFTIYAHTLPRKQALAIFQASEAMLTPPSADVCISVVQKELQELLAGAIARDTG